MLRLRHKLVSGHGESLYKIKGVFRRSLASCVFCKFLCVSRVIALVTLWIHAAGELNSRTAIAHVSDIRGTRRGGLCVKMHQLVPHPLQIACHKLRQILIAAGVLKRRFRLRNLVFAARAQRRALYAVAESLPNLSHCRHLCGSYVYQRLGVVRNYVRSKSALFDNAVKSHVRFGLLSESVHQIKEVDHGVQSVDSLLRTSRRMSCFAEKFCLNAAYRRGVHGFRILERRVRHHGNVHIVKGALFGHFNLCAVAFFRRGSDYINLRPQFVGKLPHCNSASHRHGGDQIMSAGVPDARKCVVFCQHGNLWTRLLAFVYGSVGRRYSAKSLFNLKSVFFKKFALPLTGFYLVLARFRIVKNFLCKPFYFGSNFADDAVNSLCNSLF